MTVATSANHRKRSGDDLCKYLAKFCARYPKYGNESVLLGVFSYNCGLDIVKNSILK